MSELKDYNEYTSYTPKRNGVDTLSLAGNADYYMGVDNTVDFFFDPYVSGYSFIKWIQLPSWFERDNLLKYFSAMTEKNFRSFSGIGPISLQMGTYTSGFAGREIDVVLGVNHMSNDFTLGHTEWSGGWIRKLYQRWIMNIRDPHTGIALYPAKYGIEYGAANHTAQMLYINCKPSAGAITTVDEALKTIEAAVWYTNVQPTEIDYSHMSYTVGDQSTAQLDVNFKGFAHVGDKVDAFAAKIFADQIIKLGGSSNIPFLYENGMMNNEAGATIANKVLDKKGVGTYGGVYNDTASATK